MRPAASAPTAFRPAVALAATILLAFPLAAAAGDITLAAGRIGSPDQKTATIGQVAVGSRAGSKGNINGSTWDSSANVLAYPSGNSDVRTSNAGNSPAIAQATVNNDNRRYTLTPPEGANFAGGKLIVYASLVDGDTVGSGVLEMRFDAKASRANWPDEPSGSDQVTVKDRPGSEDIELRAEVNLPAYLDSTARVNVDLGLLLKATADIAPAGGNLQTANASAKGRITAFSVLNAAGVQVPGFEMRGADGSKLTERVAPVGPMGLAVEFFNESFGHFFISANPEEIKGLDAGTVWKRTGESFKVYVTPASGRVGVCRFFGQFPQSSGPTKSSHFYALRGLGCEALLQNPGPWQYEGDVFFMPPPDAIGGCPSGTTPVYRLYNDGMTGAPNHRFTTNPETQAEMLRDGYIPEGPNGVGMCSPV
jgi:hypothetical protein